MDWKEFFRHTKAKIWLTAFLLVIIMLTMWVGASIKPRYCPPPGCPESSSGVGFNVLSNIISFTFGLPLILLDKAGSFFFVIIVFIIEVLYLYFISCLIISIFNKRLKNNKV